MQKGMFGQRPCSGGAGIAHQDGGPMSWPALWRNRGTKTSRISL